MSNKVNRLKNKVFALEKLNQFYKKWIQNQEANYDKAMETIARIVNSSITKGDIVSIEIDMQEQGKFGAKQLRITEVEVNRKVSGPVIKVKGEVLPVITFPEPLGV